MAFAKKFEELVIWQSAREVVREIYQATGEIKDYHFNGQIQRAAISIMNNIAEGFDRNNQREFRNFLRIAKASAAEVKSMCYVAEDLKYFPIDKSETLRNSIDDLVRKIGSLSSQISR